MSSRPRRSAAQKASVAITDMADRDNMTAPRGRRAGDGKSIASVSRGAQGDNKDHTYLTVKLPASKLRQATSSRHGSGSNDSTSKRPSRGNKKSYVVDDSDDDDEDEDEEAEDEIHVANPIMSDDDEDEEMEDADADGEADPDADGDPVDDEEMDIDADGDEDDEDADGEDDGIEMTPARPAPAIKISKTAAKTSPSSKKTKQATPKKTAAGGSVPMGGDDSDDDELSDLDSDDEAMNVGDEDAEGEEDEEDMDADGDEVDEEMDAEGDVEPGVPVGPKRGEMDSDDEGSRGETPDLSRMTQRQRARFEGLDESHYQALSNEVQAKKIFTVEEKAMRRAEMARRRRNLSEKRNEEVKQETINKLLKKQAGKTNRKNLGAIGEDEAEAEDESKKPSAIFIRYTSTRDGSYVAVPQEIMEGPAGRLFSNPVRPAPGSGFGGPRKMVEEVS